MIEFNINSAYHVSALFFGGSFKEDVKIEVGVFKGGKTPGDTKYKNIKQVVDIKGLALNPLTERNGNGVYSVDEDILTILAKQKGSESKIAKELLEIRKLKKLVSTYYEGIEKVFYAEDECVHGNYTHVLIPTGRTSCSKPNLQNQIKPPSKVTEHFISRFLDGVLLAADYKSVEPRVEAELCGDVNLRRDIANGVDMHVKHLALDEGMQYDEVATLVQESDEWSRKRSNIKGFTFKQQYLASAKSIANTTTLSKEQAQNIIDARMEEYPDLYKWHDNNIRQVNNHGYYTNFTGMIFKFNKYTPKPGSWSNEPYYNKNEISNYQTQGTAWVIAGIMIGKFWREKAIHNRDKYLMVNTVHDNLMLDCRAEYVEQAKEDLKILTSWKETCYNIWKYNWTVNIEIEISEGKTWYECF